MSCGLRLTSVARSAAPLRASRSLSESDDTENLLDRQSSEQPPKQVGPSILASVFQALVGPTLCARSMTLSVGVSQPPIDGCVAKPTHAGPSDLSEPAAAVGGPACRYMPSLHTA